MENSQRSRVVIALVYLGPRLPLYFRKSLGYLKSVFPESRIVLAADSDSSIRWAKKRGLETVHLDSDALLQKLPSHIVDMHFRNQYWAKVNARLFAIPKLCEVISSQEILLCIEGDMLILPGVLEFELPSEKRAFWMKLDSESDMPGLIYLRASSSEWFESRLQEQTSSSGYSDMKTLHRIRAQNSREVGLLPSVATMCDNEDQPVALFDAAEIGQWFYGEDPRNSLGVIRKRRKLRQGPDMSKLRIREDGGRLVLATNQMKWPLLSIHMHSKQRKFFKGSKLVSRLAKASESSRDSFSVRAFFTVLGDLSQATLGWASRQLSSKWRG